MKFLNFLYVGCPLYCHVYPGTFTGSTWSIDVPEPGYSSLAVIEPWCHLCDRFLLFFSQHVWHLGILHKATRCVDLMPPVLMLCCISCISPCVYVLCKCSSSCCAVFKSDAYVDISVVSVMATRLRPLLCGCCLNDDFTGAVLCLLYCL
jgi:hypothetical protein